MITDKAKSLSSKEHIEKSYYVGSEGESMFMSACISNGVRCIAASKEDNIYNHTDFFIFDNKRVDVKGLKQAHKEGFLVVEFKNVQGKNGSCSEGSMVDYIAFQLSNCFLILRKDELLNWCRKNVENKMVDRWQDAALKLYTRNGRQDLVTKIPVNRIDEFNFTMILKWENTST